MHCFLLLSHHAGCALALAPEDPSQVPSVVLGWPPCALCLLMMSMIASTLCHPPPREKQKAKQTEGRSKTTWSPQQVVAMYEIKNKKHRGGDKTATKGIFSSSLLWNQQNHYFANNGRGGRGVGVQRWRPWFSCSLFNCVLSRALYLQCLRMKTQGRHMRETPIYQVLALNNSKLVFCYFLSIDLAIIGSF